MNLRLISDIVSNWMTCVAETIVTASASRIRPRRSVRLIEEEAGSFRVEAAPGQAPPLSSDRILMQDGEAAGALPADLITLLKGSRVELVLQPNRFLFRPLELPKRASEFLDGIIRAQIDRLTPWAAADAAFGWSSPANIDDGRISLTVGATKRTLIMPFVRTLARAGAKIVAVSTHAPDAAAIKVLQHQANGALDERRVRLALAAALVGAGVSAAVAVIAAQVIDNKLDAVESDLSRRLSQSRIALRGDAPGSSPAERLLERRKHETPASSLVLEELSKILPGDTYLTGLRIEGRKLEIDGVTKDAPSLIPLLERSPYFKGANFFAPTTRTPGENGDRFHIEATLNPVFTRT